MHRTVFWVMVLLAACGSPAPDPQIASPAGWGKETFALPPDFAPFFPFRGREIIRFAPGWARKEQPDYWSYAFLWVLEDAPALTTANLQKAFTEYYSGLIGRNVSKRKISPEKLIPIQVHLDAKPGGSLSWSGTVTMLDYMAQEPITLNIFVRSIPASEASRKGLFIEVSPVSPGKGIWADLDRLVG